jgi:hypothetical protein
MWKRDGNATSASFETVLLDDRDTTAILIFILIFDVFSASAAYFTPAPPQLQVSHSSP